MGTDGLSRARFARMRGVLQRHVESGAVPGAVAAVARRGEVRVESVGSMALGGGPPMARDTIFRISSMGKPVAAVVALTLVEECVLRLDDPVDDLLPELADRRVLRSLDADVDDTVPAERPITLRDLLTFRLGHGMLTAMPGTYPIQEATEKAGAVPGPPRSIPAVSADEWMRRLGTLPLLHQPGASWHYQTGTVVLGALLMRATGRTLEDLFRERVFEPLGMPDTSFHVPADARSRLATAYLTDAQTGELALHDSGDADSKWAGPPVFPDTGGDLVSTVDDYLRFAHMLLGMGRFDGVRLLSRPSVELMTMDHLTRAQKTGGHFFAGPPETRGWGFGVAVNTGRDNTYVTPDSYGWAGGLGTSWTNDPREDLVGVLLTQAAFASETPPVVADFWTTAYQAIDD